MRTPTDRDAERPARMGDALRRLHTEKQEAERLNVSVRTLQAWRCKGGGPPFLKLGSAIRYDPSETDAWLANQCRSSTSDPGPDAARSGGRWAPKRRKDRREGRADSNELSQKSSGHVDTLAGATAASDRAAPSIAHRRPDGKRPRAERIRSDAPPEDLPPEVD